MGEVPLVQGRRDERAADAECSELRQVGPIPHTARRKEVPLRRQPPQPCQTLQVGSLAAADPGQRHEDDLPGPEFRAAFETARPEEALGPVVQREDRRRQPIRQLGGLLQVDQGFAADHRPGETAQAVEVGESVVDPERHGRMAAMQLLDETELAGTAADGVQVREIERVAGAGVEQRRDDGQGLGRRAEWRADRRVAMALPQAGGDDQAALEIHNRNQLHPHTTMRVFIFEYVTGGGLLGVRLPASLVREGELMLRALVSDLALLEGVECVITRDARLARPPLPAEVHFIHEAAELSQVWAETLDSVDAVWPIAPEHHGALERVSREVLEAGALLLNSRPAAVRAAASKLATIRLLEAYGAPVVATFTRTEVLPAIPGPWVLKPNDGVGCLGIRLYQDQDALRRDWDQAAEHGDLVAQPFLQGTAASLSLLVRDGHHALLAVNRQRIAVMDGNLLLLGCVVNGLDGNDPGLHRLAADVAEAMPGLWGYVGVDLISTPEGPRLLEVNPRLTTSYVGLRESLGRNPAGLVLDLLGGDGPHQSPMDGVAVDVCLEFADAA